MTVASKRFFIFLKRLQGKRKDGRWVDEEELMYG
jgi:hypothetical protein